MAVPGGLGFRHPGKQGLTVHSILVTESPRNSRSRALSGGLALRLPQIQGGGHRGGAAQAHGLARRLHSPGRNRQERGTWGGASAGQGAAGRRGPRGVTVIGGAGSLGPAPAPHPTLVPSLGSLGGLPASRSYEKRRDQVSIASHRPRPSSSLCSFPLPLWGGLGDDPRWRRPRLAPVWQGGESCPLLLCQGPLGWRCSRSPPRCKGAVLGWARELSGRPMDPLRWAQLQESQSAGCW